MWSELLRSCITDGFGELLRETLNSLGMSIRDFSEETMIPASTLYKIISDEGKDFRRSTLRQIILGVRRLEGVDEENVVGIITTRTALDTIGRTIEIDGGSINIKEFPATTIEEAIIQGVRAEKAGVRGIICGPIAATTLERTVDIPITAFRFDEGLMLDAIAKLVEKL
jgi:predicted transcriptional regulator